MITRNPYGIKGASVCRGEDRPFIEQKEYTNDPLPMVNHCLACENKRCRGECEYTKKGEGHRVYKRRAT